MRFNYGVMQGRLSKIGNKKLSSQNWKSEFNKAKKLGLTTIEWTLDYKFKKIRFFLTIKIKQLSKKFDQS